MDSYRRCTALLVAVAMLVAVLTPALLSVTPALASEAGEDEMQLSSVLLDGDSAFRAAVDAVHADALDGADAICRFDIVVGFRAETMSMQILLYRSRFQHLSLVEIDDGH